MNRDGSEVRPIYSAPPGDGIILAGWSADNSHVLFWLDPDNSASVAADGISLRAVPANGGTAQSLFNEVLVHQEFVKVNSRRKDVLVIAGGNRDSWTNKRLTLVDPSTGKSNALTDSGLAVASAAWSPDGNLIAYSAGPDAPSAGGGEAARRVLNQRRIRIMNSDGTGKRQLTSDAHYRDEHPEWSSDGKYIVFYRLDDHGTISVWQVQLDDGTLEKLADNIRQAVVYAPGATASTWWGYYGYIAWESFLAWLPG
jgi:hypothetical protein